MAARGGGGGGAPRGRGGGGGGAARGRGVARPLPSLNTPRPRRHRTPASSSSSSSSSALSFSTAPFGEDSPLPASPGATPTAAASEAEEAEEEEEAGEAEEAEEDNAFTASDAEREGDSPFTAAIRAGTAAANKRQRLALATAAPSTDPADQADEDGDETLPALEDPAAAAAAVAAEGEAEEEEEAAPASRAVVRAVVPGSIADLIQKLDNMYLEWSPNHTTFAPQAGDSAREGMSQFYVERYAPGSRESVPLDPQTVAERYSLYARDALVLRNLMTEKLLLRVDGELAPTSDALLARNRECVIKINTILESIWNSHQMLRLEDRQLHITSEAGRQMFAVPRLSDIRFHNVKEEDLEAEGRLKFWVLQQCYLRGYRKRGEWLFKELITKDRFHTHAWVGDIRIIDFVWKCIHPKEHHWAQALHVTNVNGAAQRVADFLMKFVDQDLPFLEETRGWWAFPNGLFYIGDLKAYNIKKQKSRNSGKFGPGLPAPELPTKTMRWGYEDGDGPKFYKFLSPDDTLPTPCHPDIGDARNVPPDIIAVNYIPAPFEIDRYITEMALYKERWMSEHKDELDEWNKDRRNEGKEHPRIALDGFHMGVRTSAVQYIIDYQFELRESERAMLRANIASDYEGKRITDQALIQAAADRAILVKEREIEHISEIHYLCLGRLLFPVDAWRFQLFLLGTSGGGKSTLLRAVQELFQGHQVSLMANRVERNFSVQDIWLNESLLWLAMDVDDKFQLDQMQWNSMVTGEGVNVSIKNKVAMSVPNWDIPGAMAGNVPPPFHDHGNSTSNRMAVIESTRPVKNANTELLGNIKFESPALMYKMVKNRHYHMRRYGGYLPYDDKNGWLGRYFKRTKNKMGVAKNEMEAFLSQSGRVHLAEGFYCTHHDFMAEFTTYSAAVGKTPHRWPYYDSTLRNANIEVVGDMCLETSMNTGFYCSRHASILLNVALISTLTNTTRQSVPSSATKRRANGSSVNSGGSSGRRNRTTPRRLNEDDDFGSFGGNTSSSSSSSSSSFGPLPFN